jgi:hypothetical protein
MGASTHCILTTPFTSPVLCKACVEEDGENSERREEKWTQKSAVLQKVEEIIKPSIGVRFACEVGACDHKVGEKVYPVDPRKKTCKIEFEGTAYGPNFCWMAGSFQAYLYTSFITSTYCSDGKLESRGRDKAFYVL